MIQLNKKQSIISIFIILHLVFFANLYYLFAFGIKTNVEVRSIPGGYDGGNNKYITITHKGKTYEFRTSLPNEVIRNINVVYSPSNPENFITYSFQQMWLGRITMSLLFGIGLAALIKITFKNDRFFTIFFFPFSIGLKDKKWSKKEDEIFVSLIKSDFHTKIEPFEYYFKYLNKTVIIDGLHKTILRTLYLKENINYKIQQVKVSKLENKTSKKAFLFKSNNSNLETLTQIEKEVLSILNSEEHLSISDLQRKSKQKFGLEFKNLNENLIVNHFNSIDVDKSETLKIYHQIFDFISNNFKYLTENKKVELIKLIDKLEFCIILLPYDKIIKIRSILNEEIITENFEQVKTTISKITHFDAVTKLVPINTEINVSSDPSVKFQLLG